MRSYKPLNKNVYTVENFAIVPIRDEDKYDIMQWRNEQMYHLRQANPLTKKAQEDYFETTVVGLFEQEKPSQILFSFLKDDVCIGYGGLVHIKWIDQHAEISFIMNTSLESNNFEQYWGKYLQLIEKVAFEELQFHKIFVYAFDMRPHLYTALEKNEYVLDARLKEHCLYKRKFLDVVIHYKLNNK
jgi:RimJ/RimL family protein N-acetyltransferase